jgi:endonuclease-3
VNIVTHDLFKRCKSAQDYADISQEELESIVRSTGFYRNKAKNIRAMGQTLVERHGGEVPSTLDQLASIPGAGRKTANVVLGNAFSKNEGVVVDTHVGRLSQRLGLTKFTDPIRIERDLMKLFPQKSWADLSHWLIFHGRRRCAARKPDCPNCELRDICPSAKE